jgi:hypothetical protein
MTGLIMSLFLLLIYRGICQMRIFCGNGTVEGHCLEDF